MKLAMVLTAILFGAAAAAVAAGPSLQLYDAIRKETVTSEKVVKTKEEWKKQLPPLAYEVLREKGTERAFTGKFAAHHEDGIYTCAGCGNHLFDSKDKFESGTGWPSFTRPISDKNIGTETDRSFFTTRTEVHCARCDGHLGHVFEDGPPPTGLRYCMNSVSLDFIPRK